MPTARFLPFLVFFYIAVIASDVTSCFGQEDLEIRAPKESDGRLVWQIPNGRKFLTTVKRKIKTSVPIGDTQLTTDLTSNHQVVMSILEVSKDGVANAENRITEIKATLQMPDIKFQYDSAHPKRSQKLLANGLHPLVKLKVPHRFDDHGNADQPRIQQAIVETIKKNTSRLRTENMIFREFYSNGYFPIPKEVKVGQKWQEEYKGFIERDDPITITTSYEYLGVTDSKDKPLHVVKATSTFKFSYENNVERVSVAKQKTTGFYFFDGNLGHVTQFRLKQKLLLKIVSTFALNPKRTMAVHNKSIEKEIELKTSILEK